MRPVQQSWFRAFVALGIVALAGCATTEYHYSQLYGQRYYKTPLDTYPVTIVRVDGKDTTLRPVLVDPGLRRITVQGPPGGASRLGEEREFALDVRPCTRYYLVAVRDNRLDADFAVRVDYEEPVGGCTPPPAKS